jgi:uncharacterized protein (DUF4213/DUF364 family)
VDRPFDLPDQALRPADLCCGPAWRPYLDLLRRVPQGRITECVVGLVWTSVTTEGGEAGVALTFPQGLDESCLPGAVTGTDLRTAAQWLLSWNYYEAALGCAAVNATTNTRAAVEELTGRPIDELAVSGTALFEHVAERFAGRKVAVVGHFPVLKRVASLCDLTILERRPGSGDTPDPACEYLLAEQDCVCITGTAVTNKTLPRLLELARSAYVVLVGPSVPLSPVWFDYGVDLLAGAVVTDPVGVRRCVQEGAHRRVFREGLTTVQIAAADVRHRGE